jgi:hypothetical protein
MILTGVNTFTQGMIEMTREMTTDAQKIELAVAFLDSMAERLDRWAVHSSTGGWSTHQVAANIEDANDCRRIAGQIRARKKD